MSAVLKHDSGMVRMNLRNLHQADSSHSRAIQRGAAVFFLFALFARAKKEGGAGPQKNLQ